MTARGRLRSVPTGSDAPVRAVSEDDAARMTLPEGELHIIPMVTEAGVAGVKLILRPRAGGPDQISTVTARQVAAFMTAVGEAYKRAVELPPPDGVAAAPRPDP